MVKSVLICLKMSLQCHGLCRPFSLSVGLYKSAILHVLPPHQSHGCLMPFDAEKSVSHYSNPRSLQGNSLITHVFITSGLSWTQLSALLFLMTLWLWWICGVNSGIFSAAIFSPKYLPSLWTFSCCFVCLFWDSNGTYWWAHSGYQVCLSLFIIPTLLFSLPNFVCFLLANPHSRLPIFSSAVSDVFFLISALNSFLTNWFCAHAHTFE